jgi:hypothetical protein
MPERKFVYSYGGGTAVSTTPLTEERMLAILAAAVGSANKYTVYELKPVTVKTETVRTLV